VSHLCGAPDPDPPQQFQRGDIRLAEGRHGPSLQVEQPEARSFLTAEGPPTVVAVSAPHCPNCRAIAPLVAAAALRHGETVRYVEVSPVEFRGQIIRFEIDNSTGGNTGAIEVRLFAPVDSTGGGTGG